MNKIVLVFFVALFSGVIFGCSEEKSNTSGDTESTSDGDADGDTDADMDADSRHAGVRARTRFNRDTWNR